MRKFLSPIINLVSLVLVGIAYGVASITAAFDAAKNPAGNYYQLVWGSTTNNALNIVGFFLFIAGSALLLFVFLPGIVRKCASLLSAGTLIAGGILALTSPARVNPTFVTQPGLIGFAVLAFIAGAFSLIIFLLELKKE